MSRNEKKMMCHNCGKLGHPAAKCTNKKQYSSTVRCYQCQKQVVSLRDHRKVCRPSSTVECFGCGQHVADLKRHKNVCGSNGSKKNRHAVEQRKRSIKSADLAQTRDFYLLLDVSGSMQGSRLSDAKATLKGLFDKMPESDRISIITFDTKAFFKLKPRPVGQIRRQNELHACLSRIFAQGATAVWDAIYMGIEQVHDKTRSTLFIVLTDGEDNCSRRTAGDCERLVTACPNVSFNIVHIDGCGARNAQYEHLVSKSVRGSYHVVPEQDASQLVVRIFDEYYAAPDGVQQVNGASAPDLDDLT